MLFKTTISRKRQKLIDAINTSPIAVGDKVGIKAQHIDKYPRDEDRTITCEVLEIDGDILTVYDTYYSKSRNNQVKVNRDKIVSRETYYVGSDPFYNWHSQIHSINFTLESVLFGLDIFGDKRETPNEKYSHKGVQYKELQWNPWVYDKDGNKQLYQRPFVWSLKDKQLLIESIYQDIECGRILVRKRSFKEMGAMVDAGETDVAFNDIVDGKQRLEALRGFMLNEYKDLHGNTYSDLSNNAQHKFVNHQLFAYCELPENSDDKGVIQQFLKLNFAGVPQSKEHITYVKDILTKM